MATMHSAQRRRVADQRNEDGLASMLQRYASALGLPLVDNIAKPHGDPVDYHVASRMCRELRMSRLC
jgi:hypothetical protein